MEQKGDLRDENTRNVIAGLLMKAKNDPSFALKMISDLDGLIDELKVKVNPNDAAYKELALKIYHFKQTAVPSFIDDMPELNVDRNGAKIAFEVVSALYF
jgi:hypothetical protein